MGKFARKNVTEHTFVSLEDMIFDVIKEIEDCENSVSIIVSSDEVPKFLTALISADRYELSVIEWESPHLGGYSGEYDICVMKTYDNNTYELYCEKLWNPNCKDYNIDLPEMTDVVFISQDVSKDVFDKYKAMGFNIVLYDIEK